MRAWLVALGLVFLTVAYWIGSNVVVARDMSTQPNGTTVAQCHERAQTAAKAIPCLQQHLRRLEENLHQKEQVALSKASALDKTWKGLNAQQQNKKSIQQWQAYQETECQRRVAMRAGGNHPDIPLLECKIEKLEQRLLDFERNP